MNNRSLVLVTVDCLRADHVGFEGYSRPVTPFLDSLSRESIVFSEAIAAGVPTYFSFPAILASRYPLGLGRGVLGIGPGEPTITTALRKAGCRTAAFLAGNPYLSPRFGYDQGFDEFHDFLAPAVTGECPSPKATEKKPVSNFNQRLQQASRRSAWTASAYDEIYYWYCQWRSSRETPSIDKLRPYPSADAIVDDACSWLGQVRNEPFFLWIHFMDAHHPHYPPPEALIALGLSNISLAHARFVNSFWNRREIGAWRLKQYREDILALYDASIWWVDKQISRLAGFLQESQRWGETVFVLTADHGEEFLEHGARYHSPANLPEQLIHVPLLVRIPAAVPARVAASPFSLIHLAPTLLGAMDVEIPTSFRGRSYLDRVSDADWATDLAIAETVEVDENPTWVESHMRSRVLAVRDRDYKLVLHFSQDRDELYDLKKDPNERAPLPEGVLKRERARLLRAASAHLQKAREDRNEGRNIDLALQARLRDMRETVNRSLM